jgi:peptidoglycan/LPS O-acetylase OafA/YrhL
MGHLSALDGLRAIAVLIVMISHAGMGHVVPGGFGVTIFFFLSGYLITTLMRLEIEREGHLSFSGFYLRRTVRIIPPMLICITVAVALATAGLLGREIDLQWLWTDLLFLTNYAPLLGGTSNIPIPLWSLDVEEHFYLLFPLLFVMALGHSRGAALALILTGLTLPLLLRIVTFQSGEVNGIFYWTHTRLDSILYGCLLAMWNNPATKDRAYIGGGILPFVIGLALICGTLLVRDDFFRETWRYSVQGVGLFFVFNYVLRTEGLVNRLLSITALKWVGNWSYVLYLIHMPMLLLAEHQFGAGVPAYAIGFALSFAFAAGMYRYVERPLFHWRKAYERRVPAGLQPKGVE